jgi:hypothetical protein
MENAAPQSTTTGGYEGSKGIVTPTRLPIRCRVGTLRGFQRADRRAEQRSFDRSVPFASCR